MIEIAGVAPPLETIGAVPVTPVTVPLLSAFIVTVVPVTEVVIPVPPVYVRVPAIVIAVPVPLSAAGVIEVTVPLPPPPPAPVTIVAVLPDTVKVPLVTLILVIGRPTVAPSTVSISVFHLPLLEQQRKDLYFEKGTQRR